ncbi:MAG: SRPBCC family protein [Propionibacteriales bacterium]|nr:SRPBCC family protein [Propionibacteriales bacterium]
MARIDIEQMTELSVEEAWGRVTEWERHADFVPFTVIDVVEAPGGGVGTVLTARTALAGVGFDDPMEVTVWEPPGSEIARCRIEKRGRIVSGWAEIEIVGASAGSRVRWVEEIQMARVPHAFDTLTRWSSRWLFARTLRGLLDA